MSHEIARAIIEDQLKEFWKLSHGKLAERVGRCDCIDGPDQNEYQAETEMRWDNKTGANIPVMVAADGAGISAFRPLAGAFMPVVRQVIARRKLELRH